MLCFGSMWNPCGKFKLSSGDYKEPDLKKKLDFTFRFLRREYTNYVDVFYTHVNYHQKIFPPLADKEMLKCEDQSRILFLFITIFFYSCVAAFIFVETKCEALKL
jgi:hypothetical protein